ADDNASLGCGAIRLKRKDDQTFLMIRQHDWLQAEAEVAFRDASAREDLVYDPIDCCCWNCQARDARERRGRDADGFTSGVHNHATRRAGVQREIYPDLFV